MIDIILTVLSIHVLKKKKPVDKNVQNELYSASLKCSNKVYTHVLCYK
jgi:hypothetical protein